MFTHQNRHQNAFQSDQTCSPLVHLFQGFNQNFQDFNQNFQSHFFTIPDVQQHMKKSIYEKVACNFFRHSVSTHSMKQPRFKGMSETFHKNTTSGMCCNQI